MSTTTESLLSLLPQADLPAPGESFTDRVILLLAATATSDGLITYREYRQVQDAAVSIFGEQAFHALIQAKLHYALLHPPVDPIAIAQDMARQAVLQEVSVPFLRTMLRALKQIANGHGAGPESNELILAIEAAFTPPEPENSFKALSSLTSIGSFNPLGSLGSLSQSIGSSIGHGVSGSLGSLHKLAQWVTPGKKGTPLSPETRKFNARMDSFGQELERIAWTLEDEALLDQAQTLRKILREQPFKVVVVGERKRGKSSLVNALIGQPLSPMRESTPETAVVVAFRYTPAPEYHVQFLDSSQFSQLEKYLADEQDNSLLQQKIDFIRQSVQSGLFVPGKLIAGATCRDELNDYISADGRFAGMVARVEVGLPLENLRGGMLLVDTPGLNDTDRFHDYLAYEESLEADCVLFVMDARDPGSRSELELLRKLTQAGRTVSVIGVLTNIDRLNDKHSLTAALARAQAVLQEACRTSEHVRLTGVLPLNARKAAAHAGSRTEELAPLLDLIQDAMRRDQGKEAYRAKITAACHQVSSAAQEHLRQHIAHSTTALPDPTLLSMLNGHATQLYATANRSLDQARQVVQAAALDLEAWDKDTEQQLAQFRERLSLRLMDAVNRKVNDLGSKFAAESVWREFETTEARDIANQCVEEFLHAQKTDLQLWEEKLRLFAANMDSFSRECLESLSKEIAALEAPDEALSGAACPATHFLVQTHQHMKKLAVFATGMSVGRLSALGPLSLLVTAGNIIALTAANPLAALVFAAVAGTAGLLYHFGREDKRRAVFLEQKRKEIDEYAQRVSDALQKELVSVREELGQAYAFEIRRGFAPALESLFQQAAHMRLFLDVMHRIKGDVSRYEDRVQQRLEKLTTSLELPASDSSGQE